MVCVCVCVCVGGGGGGGGGGVVVAALVGTFTGAAISSCKYIFIIPIGAPIYFFATSAILPAPPLNNHELMNRHASEIVADE